MLEQSTSSDFLQTLTAAASLKSANRPSAARVVDALLQAEKAAKQQRILYSVEDLLGQWQLCFATGTRKMRRGGIALSKGFYLPAFVQGQIGFEHAVDRADLQALPDAANSGVVKLQINNQLQLGAICFRVTGPAKYLNKKNLLAFDFTQMELSLLKQSIYRGNFRGGQAQNQAFDQQPIAKLPFFSFFLVAETFIAARGRGGGLAIWVKSKTS